MHDHGHCCLGFSVYIKAMRLFATALVVVYLRHYFPQQFPVRPGLQYDDRVDATWRERVKKALSWFHAADKSTPSLCTRLELGCSYDNFAETTLFFE